MNNLEYKPKIIEKLFPDNELNYVIESAFRRLYDQMFSIFDSYLQKGSKPTLMYVLDREGCGWEVNHIDFPQVYDWPEEKFTGVKFAYYLPGDPDIHVIISDEQFEMIFVDFLVQVIVDIKKPKEIIFDMIKKSKMPDILPLVEKGLLDYKPATSN